jgi:hypothetical protein
MTELRVYRTFEWRPDPHEEIRYGDQRPRAQLLVATDTLQALGDDGEWHAVPVVEAEKPPHPLDRYPGLRGRTTAVFQL